MRDECYKVWGIVVGSRQLSFLIECRVANASQKGEPKKKSIVLFYEVQSIPRDENANAETFLNRLHTREGKKY